MLCDSSVMYWCTCTGNYTLLSSMTSGVVTIVPCGTISSTPLESMCCNKSARRPSLTMTCRRRTIRNRRRGCQVATAMSADIDTQFFHFLFIHVRSPHGTRFQLTSQLSSSTHCAFWPCSEPSDLPIYFYVMLRSISRQAKSISHFLCFCDRDIN